MTEFFLTGAEPDELWPLIKQFHYSRRMPGNIQHCYAIRSAGGYSGIRAKPSPGRSSAAPPTRWTEDVIELTRLVRHPGCDVPLTKLIAFSCHWLKLARHPLAVSYADWTQRHHGGIYQAAGWLYDGQRDRAMDGLVIDGHFKPGRSCNAEWGTRSPDRLREILPGRSIEPHYDEGKHLYWKPLMIAGRTKARRLGLRSVAYPKPNAVGPTDAPVPTGASQEHPLATAPKLAAC